MPVVVVGLRCPVARFNGAAAKSSGKLEHRPRQRPARQPASMGPPLKAAENPAGCGIGPCVGSALQWGRR